MGVFRTPHSLLFRETRATQKGSPGRRNNDEKAMPSQTAQTGTEHWSKVLNKMTNGMQNGPTGRVEDWRRAPRFSLSVGSPFPLGVPH